MIDKKQNVQYKDQYGSVVVYKSVNLCRDVALQRLYTPEIPTMSALTELYWYIAHCFAIAQKDSSDQSPHLAPGNICRDVAMQRLYIC